MTTPTTNGDKTPFRESIERYIADLEKLGVTRSTSAPPLYRVLWALGIRARPPLRQTFVSHMLTSVVLWALATVAMSLIGGYSLDWIVTFGACGIVLGFWAASSNEKLKEQVQFRARVDDSRSRRLARQGRAEDGLEPSLKAAPVLVPAVCAAAVFLAAAVRGWLFGTSIEWVGARNTATIVFLVGVGYEACRESIHIRHVGGSGSNDEIATMAIDCRTLASLAERPYEHRSPRWIL